MDAPGVTPPAHLESTGDVGLERNNNFPVLTRSQTTLDSRSSPSLKKKKSLRMRPVDALDKHKQNAGLPPLPLNEFAPQQPDLRPRLSKMSLFSLFSKPKVEKLRGYAEPGLDVPGPPRALSTHDATPAKSDIVVRIRNDDAEHGRLRPASSKSYSSKRSRLIPSKDDVPPIPIDRRVRQLDPPPLFQVWPQATKSGTLETSSSIPDAAVQKTKGLISGGLFAPNGETPSLSAAGNRGSVESRMTTSSTRPGSTSTLGPSRKLFILTTSGYLLQYTESGPSDRLPEKILPLGKDSAAFASDLIPGKHHVLQVSQAVNHEGVAMPSSHSLFSRFTHRNQSNRRAASNLLLVMSGPEEMKEWMTAIRHEIEAQGGKRVRSDATVSKPASKVKAGQPPTIDLQRMPSQSHRYQVKRNPAGPSPLTSPSLPAFPSPPLTLPSVEEKKVEPEAASIPETEPEVPKTESETDSIKARPRAPSDTPSIGSSAALSVEQQQLEKLRNSIRMSHTSTTATSVTAASRTNSMTSSPPSEPSKDSSEGARDLSVVKAPYRTLSSFALAKRRSAAPLSLKDTTLPEGVTVDGAAMQQQRLALLDGTVDSPVVGFGSPFPEPSSRNGRLAFAQSVPNLKAKADSPSKHDSKIPERPESFIADLPDPTTWTSKSSPTNQKLTSSIPFPPLLDTAPVSKHQRTVSGSDKFSPTSRPLRSGSNSFSLPLRVNPIDSPPLRSPKRIPSDEQEERVLSPIPAVHTLTAKVDVATRTTIDASHIPPRKSSNPGSPPSDRPAPAKLSLFPSTTPIPQPPIFPNMDALRRSPSAAALSPMAHAQARANASSKRLARPASLQVRADLAPFLASVRSTSGGQGHIRSSTTTAPIRSLKPSRSVATMQSIRRSPSSDHFNLTTQKLATHTESADQATPLPERAASPIRLTKKGSRSSFTVVDFPLTLATLGPPAPPPSAPLPEIPGDGVPKKDRLSVVRTGTPIGIAIGLGLDEAAERRGSTNRVEGLGIAVVQE